MVIRKGIHDIWNAFMVDTASFGDYDIPFCPTTAQTIPSEIITWVEAKSRYKKSLKSHNADFKESAFVCFYIDDYKFDSSRGIWHDSKQALKILEHFGGVITPDFSTYQDFPIPLSLFATYKMRSFGYWLGTKGIPVINNVRWSTPTTYCWSFEGLPKHSILSIGTNGGSPQKLIDRQRFEEGFRHMISLLEPTDLIVYGSANYSCFHEATELGIKIHQFDSHTCKAFKERGIHE